jgi:hypothetical protein
MSNTFVMIEVAFMISLALFAVSCGTQIWLSEKKQEYGNGVLAGFGLGIAVAGIVFISMILILVP